MMYARLWIPGRFTDLNEFIRINRTSRIQANELKQSEDNRVIWACKEQCPRLHIEEPVLLRYIWVEKDAKRDFDGIAFAQKFIQDGLVKAGVLQNDGQKWVKGFDHRFMKAPKGRGNGPGEEPGVQVDIMKWQLK